MDKVVRLPANDHWAALVYGLPINRHTWYTLSSPFTWCAFITYGACLGVDETANLALLSRPSISITPPTGRIDERVHIRVRGLRASQHITLHAEQYDDEGKPW